MTIGAFDKLSENEKLEALLNGGRVISEVKDKINRCFLYYLGSFYASVEYQTETDELTAIKTLKNRARREDKVEGVTHFTRPALGQETGKPIVKEKKYPVLQTIDLSMQRTFTFSPGTLI